MLKKDTARSRQGSPLVEVNEYQKSYFDILLSMHESQDSDAGLFLSPETLPLIGYIASEGACHISAGFLRMVEGGYAQIDTLVSNKHMPSHMRHEGLSMVVDSLIKRSKDLKLKGLICLTGDKGILMRADTLGFHVVDQHVIALDLSSGVS